MTNKWQEIVTHPRCDMWPEVRGHRLIKTVSGCCGNDDCRGRTVPTENYAPSWILSVELLLSAAAASTFETVSFISDIYHSQEEPAQAQLWPRQQHDGARGQQQPPASQADLRHPLCVQRVPDLPCWQHSGGQTFWPVIQVPVMPCHGGRDSWPPVNGCLSIQSSS